MDEMHGLRRLRDERGDEQVSFNDVADHIEDFVNRRADSRDALDGFAAFLAGVEDVDHEHEGEGPTL